MHELCPSRNFGGIPPLRPLPIEPQNAPSARDTSFREANVYYGQPIRGGLGSQILRSPAISRHRFLHASTPLRTVPPIPSVAQYSTKKARHCTYCTKFHLPLPAMGALPSPLPLPLSGRGQGREFLPLLIPAFLTTRRPFHPRLPDLSTLFPLSPFRSEPAVTTHWNLGHERAAAPGPGFARSEKREGGTAPGTGPGTDKGDQALREILPVESSSLGVVGVEWVEMM